MVPKVDTLDDAFVRISNASTPFNEKRLNLSTPCTTIGRCVDCQNEDRMGRASVVIEKNCICHILQYLL